MRLTLQYTIVQTREPLLRTTGPRILRSMFFVTTTAIQEVRYRVESSGGQVFYESVHTTIWVFPIGITDGGGWVRH